MKKMLKILAVPLGLCILYVIFFLCIEFLYILPPSKGPAIVAKNNVKSAVLVIDVQDRFTATDDPEKARELGVGPFIDSINLALKKLTGVEAVYIRQEFRRGSLLSYLAPMFPVEGEPGTGINPAVYRQGARIFTKSRADAFTNPELQRYLDSRRVGTLYITGLAAEACVQSTLRGAAARGYTVFVIPEAVASMKGGAPDRERLAKYESYGAKIVPLVELK